MNLDWISMDQEIIDYSFRSRYDLEKLREGNYHEWIWNIQSLLEEIKLWLHIIDDISILNDKNSSMEDDEKSLKKDILKWKE
jgi:hypothetical protein